MENATPSPERSAGCDANRTRRPTRIIADYREKDAGVLRALSDTPEVEVQVTHLTRDEH